MALGDTLKHTARRNPEGLALVSGDMSVSYAELESEASRLAVWFLDQGLNPGDRIALYWSNSIETVTLLFGSWKAGLVVVPINVRLKGPEVAYVLSHSEASICFAQPEFALLVQQAQEIGRLNIRVESRLPASGPTASQTLPTVDESEIAVILYTSGTTAQPKGVAHTHASVLQSVRLVLTMVGEAGPISLVTTQLAHVSGLFCFLLPFVTQGRTAVLMSSFSPALALDYIDRFQVTFTGGLPAMVALMLEEQRRRPRRARSLKTFISGGDSVPVALQDAFASLFGLPMLELLGMTESCPICWNQAGDIRPGSLGKARAGVSLKAIGEGGKNASMGELAVRSPANFKCYWRDPESTSMALRDGWLYTGDLVHQDEHGYLWFDGRLKHIIVRSGSNIAPQEVEAAFYYHAAIKEAAVVGLPDAVYGEKIAAFLVLCEGISVDPHELLQFVRERLADYKVPEIVQFLSELPKGLTGKVDRRKLADMVLSQTNTPLQLGEARV